MVELKLIVSFGRTASFDLLLLLGDLGVFELDAPGLYLADSGGPEAGARRLLPGQRRVRELDDESTKVVAGRTTTQSRD